MFFRKALKIERVLGYKFRNYELLERALTHPSAAENHLHSYQRLEFLGDALLDFLVAEWLFGKHPDTPEGGLTEMRRIMVNSEALARIAKILAIEEFVVENFSQNNGEINDSILCDVYEALLAAIYLDGGIAAARHFVEKSLFSNAELLLSSPSFVNYKGKLLELLQSRGCQPRYEVLETQGPQHKTFFKIGVYLDRKLLGVGTGYSKKEAEQQASKRALEMLHTEESKEL